MPEKYFQSKKILDHYRKPKNFGILKNATHKAEQLNPLCGDEISVFLNLSTKGGSASGGKNNKINDIKFQAQGCVLTIAAASLLSERIKNKGLKIKDIEKLKKADIEKLLGTKISSAREPCITLGLDAIKKALIN